MAIAILGPIMKLRQARLGWYAVTDRRAIVFHVSLWGKSGAATDYTPRELRRMQWRAQRRRQQQCWWYRWIVWWRLKQRYC